MFLLKLMALVGVQRMDVRGERVKAGRLFKKPKENEGLN
jgi:hypothetical protein